MQVFLKCVKKSFNIIKWLIKRLRKNIPLILDDSEELVRRCQKRAIRSNGKIHKSVFFYHYPEISVDRSKYRPYKQTLQVIPETENTDNWFLIGGIVQNIRPIEGVEEVKANPLENNPAHALIVCDSGTEKRNKIAGSLSEVFQKISEEEYRF